MTCAVTGSELADLYRCRCLYCSLLSAPGTAGVVLSGFGFGYRKLNTGASGVPQAYPLLFFCLFAAAAAGPERPVFPLAQTQANSKSLKFKILMKEQEAPPRRTQDHVAKCGTPLALAFHVSVSAFRSLRKGQNPRLANLLVTSTDVAHDFCHRGFWQNPRTDTQLFLHQKSFGSPPVESA